MHSVHSNPSTGEVLFLVNQETFKVNKNKRALVITKPEKKKRRKKNYIKMWYYLLLNYFSSLFGKKPEDTFHSKYQFLQL